MDVGFREDGNTTISGPVVDQAVLHGVLARVRDLGIVLSFVQRAEEARPTQSTSATFAVVAGQETSHNPRTGMHNAAAQDIQGS
jgi:hypothetical protein